MQQENHLKTIRIGITLDDFVLSHIFDCGQCFRWKENEDGSYTGTAGGRVARISISEDPGEKGQLIIEQADLDQSFSQAGSEKASRAVNDEQFWQSYFDLECDYGAIKEKLAEDDVMKKVIPFGHGIRILKQEPWETTVSFIISQNNNIPRIKRNIRDLSCLFGEKICDAFGDEWYDLPAPEKLACLSADDLAQVRLGYRARYLIETAKCICERGMDVLNEDIGSLCGVGPKVASCIRLFGLGIKDSFPVDVWVKRVMSELYGIEKPSEIKRFAEDNFGMYGGIAQQYLFYFMRENSYIDKLCEL